MKVFFTLLLFSAAFFGHSQSILGVWQTVDDRTEEPRAHVKIYKEGKKFYGKIIKIVDPDAPQDATCRDCPDGKDGKPLLGLVILEDLKKDGDKYRGGEILDPEKGKTYDCKVWLNEDNPDLLMVRGYLLFLYRTQMWERVSD